MKSWESELGSVRQRRDVGSLRESHGLERERERKRRERESQREFEMILGFFL